MTIPIFRSVTYIRTDSPGQQQMKEEWHVSTVAILCGITTFTSGFGVAPMVLAPFSEINGRVTSAKLKFVSMKN
jgi:hypothetical protein